MKKLVLVAAMFTFVCGGSFLAQAKVSDAQPAKSMTLTRDTVVTDTVQQAPCEVPDTTAVAE